MAFIAETELRKFCGPYFDRIVELLHDENKSWRKLATLIPMYKETPDFPMYSKKHMEILDSIDTKVDNPAACLLDDWGTRGKIRATIRDLYDLLVKLELYRIACEISTCVKSIPEPPKPFPHELSQMLYELENGVKFRRISYVEVDWVTGSFAKHRIIGEGQFGVVYYGEFETQKVGVKRLKSELQEQFKNEVGNILRFQHPNLLPIIAYSDEDPNHCCIVYEYMCNGNLKDRLACKDGTAVLDWKQRIEIAVGTARGIVHLHTFDPKQPLIHRDIKTANILLDHEWMPKVGDYGFVHIASNSKTLETQYICGTKPYIPFEAFNGAIRTKNDTYSFGVVLLELITGLAPFDSSREERDLVSHVRENYIECDLTCCDLRTNWPDDIAVRFFKLSTECIQDYKDRPTMEDVLQSLEKLLETMNEESIYYDPEGQSNCIEVKG